MSRKTIQFGNGQTEYISIVVKQRGYRSDSEYIRDLVRRDEERNRAFLETKSAIQEGLDSGVSKRSVEEIFKSAEERYLAKRKEKENA